MLSVNSGGGSSGDVTSEEDRSDKNGSDRTEIENLIGNDNCNSRSCSPGSQDIEDSPPSSVRSLSFQSDEHPPRVPSPKTMSETDYFRFEREKYIKSINHLKLEKTFLVNSVVRLSAQVDDDQKTLKKELASLLAEVEFLKAKCEEYASAQKSIEVGITETLRSEIDDDGHPIIDEVVIEGCIQVFKRNFPIPFAPSPEASNATMRCTFSDEQLDIFIDDWNMNPRVECGLNGVNPAVTPAPDSDNMDSAVKKKKQFPSVDSFSSLKGSMSKSSSNNFSPSTRSLASHLSMDSLRRRTIMNSGIETTISDTESVISSISTHNKSPCKKQTKQRKACICGAYKPKQKLKPSTYRYYDDDGRCIITENISIEDLDASLYSLTADDGTRSSENQIEDDVDDSSDNADDKAKKSGMWGFFKF